MTETIDLTPRGLQTPEGVQRTKVAFDELQSATVMVANAATEFFNEHRMTLLTVAGDESHAALAALRDAIHQMDALLSARNRKQEAFLAAIAGHPAPERAEEPQEDTTTFELTEIMYAEANSKNNSWALYLFDDDGFHSGKQWFSKVIKYPNEEITVPDARTKAEAAIALGHEVRVCDGSDFLVFHSQHGKTTYGEGFWEAIQGG